MASNQNVPPVEVEVVWKCSMDMELHAAPANFTAPAHTADKQPLMEPLVKAYENGDGGRKFGAFQQAGFALASPAVIEAVRDDPRELRALADSFRAWTQFFVKGLFYGSESNVDDAEEAHVPPTEGSARTDGNDSTAAAAPNFIARTLSRFPNIFGSQRQAGPGIQVPSTTTLKRPSEESPAPGFPAAKKQKIETRRAKAKPRNQAVAAAVKRRDGEKCIFTFNRFGIEAAHILPHAINSTPEGVSFFTSLLSHLSTMFGGPFTQRLRTLLGSLVSSDGRFNMLTLNVYVHWLYEGGLVGFRPLKITECKDNRGISFFQVHLAIHWLGKTEARMQSNAQPETLRLVEMATLRPEFTANRQDYDVLNTATRMSVQEGQVAIVRHCLLDNATKMYDLLAFSWNMRMMLFLAGGAGTPDGDPRSDEYYDEEWDISPEQIEDQERFFRETMQLEERRGATSWAFLADCHGESTG